MMSLRRIFFLALALGIVGATSAGAQDYKPFRWGDWSLAPTLSLNSVLTDNLYGGVRKIGGAGVEFLPSMTFTRDTGFSVTTLSGNASAIIYPGQYFNGGPFGNLSANTHAESFSGRQIFNVSREQTISLLGSYNQSSGGFTAPTAGLISTTSSGDVRFYTLGAGTERKFGRLRASLDATFSQSDVQNSRFSPIVVGTVPGSGGSSSGLVAALPNGRSTYASATARLAYDAPFWSPYVASSAGWQSQETSSTDSFQVNVGVATGRWRLFKAEAYVGYLWQNTRYDALLGVTRSDVQSGTPSFGASLTWDPLRYLTLTGTVSAQFGAIALPSAVNLASAAASTPGTPTPGAPVTPAADTIVAPGQDFKTYNFGLSARYDFARRWNAQGSLGYTIFESAGNQTTRVMLANLSATYLWTRADDLTLSYSYVKT
ncbi:MAG: putative beta-barrel porin 2, partial [Spirosoma sp.]|nr:putative beta-barrel porin 2 [Spirosoma sp.]